MKLPKEQINGRRPLGELSEDLEKFEESLKDPNARIHVTGFTNTVLAKAIQDAKEEETKKKD